MAASLDVKLSDFVPRAIIRVFSTMMSLKLEALDSPSDANLQGERVVGSVGFAGAATGMVYFQVTDVFARIMTASMLGRKLQDINGADEVNDAIGELSNMIGGNLKSCLSDSGFPCALSIPSITRGSSFNIQTRNGAWCERFAFQYQEHHVLVEISVRVNSTEGGING